MSKKIDLTGMKFNSLAVIKELPRRGHNSYWLCQCDCGELKDISGWNLKSGKTKQCWNCGHIESGKKRRLNLLNKRFGFLLVIENLTKLHDRRTSWLCKCDCGKDHKVYGYHLNSGRTTRCIDCAREAAGQTRKGGELSNGTWGQILAGARSRNIDVLLSKEEALEIFINQNRCCALTGVSLKLSRVRFESKKFVTASLDRIDSKKPYEKSNVQWIHKELNIMKNSFNQQKFIDWCVKVSDKWRKK